MEQDVSSCQLLRRRPASDYLRARGFPVAPATLAKLASVGGGPEFQRFGRVPLYAPEALDRWVASRLSAAVASTSELGGRLDAGEPRFGAADALDDGRHGRPRAVQAGATPTGRIGG
jgi:hypothetical protein